MMVKFLDLDRFLWPLLFGHGELELRLGIDPLHGVSQHLDREVTQRGVGRGVDGDVRFLVPVLDGGGGGFDRHALGDILKLKRDVFVEVCSPHETNGSGVGPTLRDPC